MKRVLLVLVMLILRSLQVSAQPSFDEAVADTTPINGWLILLLVIGIGYGIKKLYYSKARQ